ncbi:GAF sensor signal transduction histidine kinase [Stanieria sp. NIES-3757]|nr:GAF sensor signal transduction histidine kinase [Stanieria sp. NIES-3757]
MLTLQTEREKLVAAIALRIRQSLDLDVILNQTVEEVRQFLQADRVLIFRFEPDWSGLIVVESLVSPWQAVFGQKIHDPCFTKNHIKQYQQGRVQVIENIYAANLSSCHIDLLASLEVKANLVVPIVAEEELWGLLIAQQCSGTRKWHLAEVELLKQLAIQVGIAIQQAELYQQVQSFNIYLERKVKQRTSQLQQALQFEALIRRVTEKVRDSFDEGQILQIVTQELAKVLKIERCKIELYDPLQEIATIVYEYTTSSLTCQGIVRQVADFPELYQQLLEKQTLQFVEIIPELSPKRTQATRLVCPIFDDQGILGNLWLLKPREQIFDKFEIRLVQQVANQCAIAIRQARLYETAQTQVQELAKLNNLKDDFLKTISHELRTPMSSILLASQTLEKLIETGQQQRIESRIFKQVFRIFKNSCKQQNKLVTDLLTLCYIDADNVTLMPEWVDLKVWLPTIVESFREQTQYHQQQLIINLLPELPLLESDLSFLERIVNELLNNACKYTPAGETIMVSAWATQDTLSLSFSNSGIEIASEEQKCIFEKFYRIPSHDPWQYGGTGIGLALVKKLVELLSATIEVESHASQTTFTLQFPLEAKNLA